jgi:dTMP kinase
LGNGLFIALEGIEGCGKSTQIPPLADRLRSEGLDVVLVREPGGTPFAEEMRHFVLHHPHELTAASELLLYQAARSDLTTRVIRPALAEGRVVLADRYELSTRAYQAAGRGLPLDQVKAAIALATGGLEPDLYVVFDLAFEAGRERQRREGKTLDKLESADEAFHRRVAAAYLETRGPNIAHIDAAQPADVVAERIWQAVASRLPTGHPSGSSGQRKPL